jgi:hypothetical protein
VKQAMLHTTRIVINLVWLACTIGVLYLIGLILAQDVGVPVWLPFDIHEGGWLAIFLRLFGVVIIAPPVFALIFSVMQIGADQSRAALYRDPSVDYLTLRLPAGTKVAGVGLSFLLFLAIIGALIWQDEPLGIWLFASPLMILGLYGMAVFSLIRVDFDQDHIVAMTPLFRWQRHKWSALVAVTHHRDWQELRLKFEDGRIARVSTLFNHLPEFIAFMQAKTKENDDARAARG